MKFDLEEPSWDPLLEDCDLIHMRTLFGSIETNMWEEMYRKMFKSVIPLGSHGLSGADCVLDNCVPA